jgi:poly(ADP-ribose) glycohydrolase ARH3
MDRKLSKFIGCITGTAIGDSLGNRREGSDGSRENADLAPRYTEDTVMTIGVAESLIEHPGFHYWHMTERLLKNYEQEPWRRYGNTVSRVFRLMRNGRLGFGMLDRGIFPDGSYGNGAAVRVGPVGLLFHDDPRLIRDMAYHCADITHSHELAREGAAVQACAVALAVLADPEDIRRTEFLGALRMFTRPGSYQEKLKTIVRFLEKKPARQEVIEGLGNISAALHSVPTAIYSFLAGADFAGAVNLAMSLGGDADAIGAMTGAIAGACYGIEGIPSQWRETVENRDYLERLGRRLWEVNAGISRKSVDDVAEDR